MIEQALAAGGDMSEVEREIQAVISSSAEQAATCVLKRQALALGEFRSVLSEMEHIVKMLAAASNLEQAKELWGKEMRSYYSKESESFTCECAGVVFPLGFEYNPRSEACKYEQLNTFRQAFASAFDPAKGKAGPTVLVVVSPDASSELVQSTCALLGTVPVVLKGRKLMIGDTFWSRVAAAAKSTAVGAFPVVAIEDAGEASKDVLEVAANFSKEYRFALCMFASSSLPIIVKSFAHIEVHVV